MQLNDLRADLSVKMLELEQAIDLGMPYSQIRDIYQAIKELQYQIITTDTSTPAASTENAGVVME